MKRRIRDGEGTQAKILDTAEKMFSETGFAGTSIGKISKASGISEGLILHHFKTKTNLYSAVRERVANRYKHVLDSGENVSDPSGPEIGAMMVSWVKTVFDYFKNDHTYHRISLWSYLEGKTDVIENEAKITNKMVGLVKTAQKMGIMQSDFDPETLLTMTIGSIHYWLRYRTQFQKILDSTKSIAELDERFIDQTTHLLMRSVRKRD